VILEPSYGQIDRADWVGRKTLGGVLGDFQGGNTLLWIDQERVLEHGGRRLE